MNLLNRLVGWTLRMIPACLGLAAATSVASAGCPNAGMVRHETTITYMTSGCTASDNAFGRAAAHVGDIDGDGVSDLAVGEHGDDDGGTNHGAVWILFLNANGSVREWHKISSLQGGFAGTLNVDDQFGVSIAGIGDLDGDQVPDIAVGAWLDDDGGPDRGAVWILYLRSDGTVKSDRKISNSMSGFAGLLGDNSAFGSAIAYLGPLATDGAPCIAVGALSTGPDNRGAIWNLFLGPDGTVVAHQQIANGVGGFPAELDPADQFGCSAAPIGDLDGNQVPDLAVGAWLDDDGGTDRGAAWILLLNASGMVIGTHKVSATAGGFTGALETLDFFGASIAELGDLDHDGITEVAVGAPKDDDGGTDRGAVWVLFLDAAGAVKSHLKYSSDAGIGNTLLNGDLFGISISNLGDLDGDGFRELAIGAQSQNSDGIPGAVRVLSLNDCDPDSIVITRQPASVLLPASGGLAEFTVVATGEPPLVYQWRKDSLPLSDGDGIMGSQSSALVIVAGPEDVGSYDCVVSNGAESVTSAAAILAVRPSCAGDADGDGAVGLSDIGLIIQHWAKTCP